MFQCLCGVLVACSVDYVRAFVGFFDAALVFALSSCTLFQLGDVLAASAQLASAATLALMMDNAIAVRLPLRIALIIARTLTTAAAMGRQRIPVVELLVVQVLECLVRKLIRLFDNTLIRVERHVVTVVKGKPLTVLINDLRVLPLRGFRRHNCCPFTIAKDALGRLQVGRLVVVDNAAESLLVTVFGVALRRLLIILFNLAVVEFFSFC